MTQPLQWAVTNSQDAAAAMSVSVAGTPGVIHVCTAIILTCTNNAGSTYAGWSLLDGATTLIDGYMESLPASGTVITLSGLNLPGLPGNAMTLSQGAWTAGGCFNAIAMIGYDL